MFNKTINSHTRRVYGAGPEDCTIVTYQEVSMWEEFLAMFSNKDDWRYVVQKDDKYLFIRTERELFDVFEWNNNVFDATMFATYGRALTFEKAAKELDNKNISIIVLKPTIKDNK